MKLVEPKVFLIVKPQVDWDALHQYLEEVGGLEWFDRVNEAYLDDQISDAEVATEAGGRLCYRSWTEGLNANVTRVRKDSGEYFKNLLKSRHGSVLEHANFTFILHNVSRVFTHELVRHRVGVGISQESMRYVRYDDFPFWIPEWAQQDKDFMLEARHYLEITERFTSWMINHFGIDDEGVPFHEKKHKTSFIRRFIPHGVATGVQWTANIRILRHVIENRTNPGAEEEMRLIFDMIARIMIEECPFLFQDFDLEDGYWRPSYLKV